MSNISISEHGKEILPLGEQPAQHSDLLANSAQRIQEGVGRLLFPNGKSTAASVKTFNPISTLHHISEKQKEELVTANLRVAPTPDEGFEWKKRLIASAQKSIELSPNFAGGEDFREILNIIKERMETFPQLKVHLLLNPEFLEKKDKELLNSLQREFSDRFFYFVHKPILRAFPIHTEENHTKILVVDSKYFVIGGSAIAAHLAHEKASTKGKKSFLSSMLSKSSRDCDIAGEGKQTAALIRRQFFKVFRLCEQTREKHPVSDRYFSLPPGKTGKCKEFSENPGLIHNAKLKVLVSGPKLGKENPITAEYAKRISEVKRGAYLGTLYFYPDKKIAQALKSIKGKKVCLISNGTPYLCALGQRIGVIFSRLKYYLLTKAFEYQGPMGAPPLYHRKIGVFDDTHSIIGSYNLAYKSARYDYEIAVAIENRDVARKFKEVIKKDLKEAKKVNLQKYPKGGWYSKFYHIVLIVKNFF